MRSFFILVITGWRLGAVLHSVKRRDHLRRKRAEILKINRFYLLIFYIFFGQCFI